MARKRLSREDSRERTAQRLLDSAGKLIAQRGLDATSVEDIAEEAGYSRGAFYSNFASKNDLFFELVRRDQLKIKESFDAVVDDRLSLDEIQEKIQQLYASVYEDDECFMAWTEARMLSARDAKFREKLDGLMLEKRDHIVALIDYFCRRAGMPPVIPHETLAMGFMSVLEGVRLYMVSNPKEMTPEAAQMLLRLFIGSVMQQMRQPAKS